MAAHQAPPSLGFSRQEHWSGLPFPSPMHESEKWKSKRPVVSDASRPYGLQPTRLLCPWDSPGKSTGVGCHCLLWEESAEKLNSHLVSAYPSKEHDLQTGKGKTKGDAWHLIGARSCLLNQMQRRDFNRHSEERKTATWAAGNDSFPQSLMNCIPVCLTSQ